MSDRRALDVPKVVRSDQEAAVPVTERKAGAIQQGGHLARMNPGSRRPNAVRAPIPIV